MKQTRVITIEITTIGDSSDFGDAEAVKEYWLERHQHDDDVHVEVKDFITEEEQKDE